MKKPTPRIFLSLLVVATIFSYSTAQSSGQERGGGDVPSKPNIDEQFVRDVFTNQSNIKSLSLMFHYIESKQSEFFKPLFDDKSKGERGSVFEFLKSINIETGTNVTFAEDCTDQQGQDRGMMALINSAEPLQGKIHICPAKLAQRHSFDFRDRPSLERANLLALFVHELVHIFMGPDEQTADRLLAEFPIAKRLLEYKMLENKLLTEYQYLYEYRLLLKNNPVVGSDIQSVANICNSLPALELPGDFMPVAERAQDYKSTTDLINSLESAAESACRIQSPARSAINHLTTAAQRLLSRLNERLPMVRSQLQLTTSLTYPIPASSSLRVEPELDLDQAPFVEDWQICARRSYGARVRVLPHRICSRDSVISAEEYNLQWGWNERSGATNTLQVESTVRNRSVSAHNSISELLLRVNGATVSPDLYRKKVNCYSTLSANQLQSPKMINICTGNTLNYRTLLHGLNRVKVLDVFEGGLVTIQYDSGTVYTVPAMVLSAD